MQDIYTHNDKIRLINFLPSNLITS